MAKATELDQSKRDWLEKMARVGYAMRGVVYLLVAIFALTAAFGGGGEAEGTRGALEQLLGQPFGKVLLVLIGLGMFCFALWRLLEGIYDADNKGTDKEGLTVRTSNIIGGVVAVLLGIFAISLVFGNASAGGSGGGGQQTWVAKLMAQPFGMWLVGIVGVIVIAVGIAQFVKAVREKFRRHLAMPPNVAQKAVPVCKAGIIARGVVFCIIGIFLVVAAYQQDPGEARGLQGALETLREQAYGPWLLGLVALGLVGYAIYNFIEAKYRIIAPPADANPAA
jgi:hypothetical protein